MAFALKAFDHFTQLFPDASCGRLEIGIFNRLHGCYWIDCGDLGFPTAHVLDDNIAGEHGPYLVFDRERLIGNGGAAGAKDEIATEFLVELLLEHVLDIDLRDDPEPLLLKRLGRAPNGFIKVMCQNLRKVIGHPHIPIWVWL